MDMTYERPSVERTQLIAQLNDCSSLVICKELPDPD